MPRVLRIINRLNLGGPTYNAAYLSALMQPEFETMLVAGMRDESEESSEFILEKMNLSPHYIRAMRREINFRDDFQAFQDIKEIIREFKPDIVHTHAAKAGAVGRIAASGEKVPVILHTFHGHVFKGYFNPLTTRVFIGLERYLARLSTGIIAISESQKKELAETYRICPSDKIKVIPLGFDLSRFHNNQQELRTTFRNEFGLDKKTVAVGIIGRLVDIKNHKLFLEAWARLMKKTSAPIHAFIIGDGELRSMLESACRSLGIPFNVPGQLNREANLTFTSWIIDIERALAGLDIVALTSNNEGTPVSLIEAQAAGKPVISTDVGGVSDTMTNGETGLLIPAGNVDTLTEALSRLSEDESLRIRMGARGSSLADARFGVSRLVDDMRSYYNSLL